VLSWLLFWAFFNILLWTVKGFDNMAPAVFYPEEGTRILLSGSTDLPALRDLLFAMGGVLIISVGCYVLVVRVFRNNVLRLVLAWFSFHGWNFVFGMLVYSLISSTSLSVVADYLLMGDLMRLLVIEVSLFGLFISGLLIAKPSFEYIVRFQSFLYLGKVKYLILLLVLIPFLAGSGLISLVFCDILPALKWIMILYVPSLVCATFRIKRLSQARSSYHHRRKMPPVRLN